MSKPPATIGRYEIQRPLTDSGPATLYVARDPWLDRVVAIRTFERRDQRWDESFRRDSERFAAFDDPHIARLIEFGFDGRLAFHVTPYRDEVPLAAVIRQFVRIELAWKLWMMAGVCRGTAYALERTATHLDITPTNLWVGPDLSRRDLLSIKIASFPASWDDEDDEDAEYGRRRTIARSPTLRPYLSPEERRGDVGDERSATFTAGVVLYELLARHQPSTRDDPLDDLWAIEPEPMAAPSIEAILRRALAQDPRDRFERLGLLADALAAEAQRLDAAEEREQRGRLRSPPSRPSPKGDGTTPLTVDKVQFTVYQPTSVARDEWGRMLVFTHLADRPPDAAPDEPSPMDIVKEQARAILGKATTHDQETVDSRQLVPREGEITLVPRIAGVEFNPPTRSFRWTAPVHREEFLLRVTHGSGALTGQLTIFLGSIILAEIDLTIATTTAPMPRPTPPVVTKQARPYRRIFASYAHLDRAIVEEYAAYAKAIGDRYLQDVIDLRSGEPWEEKIYTLIARADVFQLFWSWNALESSHVRKEWQYALGLGRPRFVRPVFWDEPMPKRDGLPPEELLALHFQRIEPRRLPRAPAAPAPPYLGGYLLLSIAIALALIAWWWFS